MRVFDPNISRRRMLGGALLAGAALFVPATVCAATGGTVDPVLRGRALAALGRHRAKVAHADKIAIVDYARASRDPRFHILDIASGGTTTYLVAHGRGSDPAHTGWLSRWSNEEGSNASSSGAYVTDDFYVGQHGQSMRLDGLDPTNDAAEPRAIVVHAAWYVSPAIIRVTGKLGRSEGCFALALDDLKPVLDQLGNGRMIYADKV